MKKMLLIALLVLGCTVAGSLVRAQDAGEAAPQTTGLVDQGTGESKAPTVQKSGVGFWAVVFGSGWLGVILWLGLFGCGAAAIYFIVDCSILVRPQKVMGQALIEKVKAAMAEGDVLKAIKACETEPGPMANILTAGFAHVEEGYDIIQEAVGTAADLETERMMQRLTWISVCSNLAPMLGLLGTVQGMIMAFENIATGAPDTGALALSISQALWTTAGGLVVAIPAITFYFSIRNNASRLVLRMEAMTMELIKDLRNVEVVND